MNSCSNILYLTYLSLGTESKLLSESTKNLKRALGAEGTIKDLKFKIKSLKRQLNK